MTAHDRRDLLAFIIAILGCALALMVVSCREQPPTPTRDEPVPAARRAQDLDDRLQAAAIDKAQAEAAAKTATTPTARASAEAEAIRASLISVELRRLRDEAAAEAIRQRAELDARAVRQAQEARASAQAEQAAADRRWALLASAAATALAVAAGVVLGWLGFRRLAVLLPLTIAAAAAVGLGILSAGPWLPALLATIVILATIAGLIYAGRAIAHAVAYGDQAAKIHPDDATALYALQSGARDGAEDAGVRGLIKAALRRARG
jgi:hypothetical protein